MKKLMNTLYVTSANRYLSLDGENVVILEEQKEIGRVPLYITWRESLHLDIQEQARDLWELARRRILALLL